MFQRSAQFKWARSLWKCSVVIESIAEEKKTDKKTVNPPGWRFFSGQQAKDVNQSIAQLRTHGFVSVESLKTCFARPAS